MLPTGVQAASCVCVCAANMGAGSAEVEVLAEWDRGWYHRGAEEQWRACQQEEEKQVQDTHSKGKRVDAQSKGTKTGSLELE